MFHTLCGIQKGPLIGQLCPGETGFKFTNTSSSSDHETHSQCECACNYVCDTISVSQAIHYGKQILSALNAHGGKWFAMLISCSRSAVSWPETQASSERVLSSQQHLYLIDPASLVDQAVSSSCSGERPAATTCMRAVCSVASVMSNSCDPMNPTRLLHPWDFPGKITGGLPFPPPGNLPDPGTEPPLLRLLHW